MRFLLLNFLLFSSMLLFAESATKQPNVILIITDDQGYGDISAHGNPILKTPEIDKLHSESIRLTNYHVSPTCSPTRGALMSGHYTNRCGTWHTIMGRSILFEGEKTLGEIFKDNGYATGMFGKWHLGDSYPFRPEDRGFAEVVRHGGGGAGQTPDFWDNAYFDDTYFHNSTPKKYAGYCTDVFFSEAQRFIKESKDSGKPFFAYIATNAPHGPYHAPEKYTKPYMDKFKNDKNKATAIFFGMIANIDENIGKLRDFLKSENLSDNTIFIFTTDNGTAGGEAIFNAGMRDHKGSPYDGGHRAPFFLHWKNGGYSEGKDVTRLTAHIDILPTLVDICQLKPIEENYKLDGRSLISLLKNPSAPWEDRTIITDSQRVTNPIKWRNCAVMTEKWRLINGKELYDINADPGQKNDISATFPDVVTKLRQDYDLWWKDISPAFSKFARFVIGNKAENPTTFTAHDWIVETGQSPWNQAQIRQGNEDAHGKWAVKVEEKGKFQIVLRRWPFELKKGLNEGIPPGEPVPGLRAFRETPGKPQNFVKANLKVGEFNKEINLEPNAEEAIFEVELEPGDYFLEGNFLNPAGKLTGAFYARIKKL